MFDPHRTRRNDRRYYTRKGQVIQAKSISAPFTIDRSKVDAYKEYIIKNHLVDFPSPPPTIPIVDSIKFSDDSNTYPISSMNTSTTAVTITGPSQTIALINSDDPNYYLVYIIWCPSSSAAYQLPAGCRYKKFVGVGAVNDFFQLKQGDTVIIEFAQTHISSTQTTGFARVQINAIRKDVINISDLPA